MDLSIIIVTHNSMSPVEKCLGSLGANPPAGEYEVTVVDNASVDGTPEMIRNRFPSVKLIANSENQGYSRGVNQGIRKSSGRYLLIINPDIEVGEGSIDHLTGFMEERPRTGIAGSKLVFPDGKVQESCRTFYTMRALILRRTILGRLFPNARALREHLMSDYDHAEAREVDWVIGACMIVRREALESVGMMDERFFLYLEDTDWCYRMKQHGWEVWYVPGSVMMHRYARSSARSVLSKPFLFHMLSLLRYYEKWNRIFHFLRRYRGFIKSSVFVITDLITINASFFAAYYLRAALQPLFINELYPLDWYAIFIIFYNFIFFVTFFFIGLYRIRRQTGLVEELSSVIRSVMIVFAVLLTASYLTKIRIFSRAVLLGQAVFTIISVTGARRLIRRFHRDLVRASFDLKRVVLAGTQEEFEEFSSAFSGHPDAGIDIVGRVGKGTDALGPIVALPGITDQFKIQEVIFLPSYSTCEDAISFMLGPDSGRVRVRIVSSLARIAGSDLRIADIGRIHMFAVERGAGYYFTNAAQRIMDLTAGALLLPLSVLFWLPARIVGLLGGKIMFSSQRRFGNRCEISWPRVSLPGGGEASDMLKPRIFAYLITGKLSLIGPPAHVTCGVGDTGGMKPGITGYWRIEPRGSGLEATADEILMLHRESFIGRILLLVRSISPFLSGRYPDWFYSGGVGK
jgi:GT2 family glycosyltransferase